MFVNLIVSIISKSVLLDEENFNDTVFRTNNKNILVEFWNPWCSHCSHFRPVWDNLANDSSLAKTTVFADVNCNQEKGICDRFKIIGTPTILYFPNETREPIEYQGALSSSDVRTFLHKQLQFPIVFIDTFQEIESLKIFTNTSSIFFLKANLTDEKIISKFKSAAHLVRTSNARFYVTQSNETEIGVYRDDGDPLLLSDNFDDETLSHFVQKYKDPVLPPLSGEIFDKMKNEKKVGIIFYVSNDDERKIFTPMISKLRPDLMFSYFIYEKTDHLFNFMRIKRKDLPLPLIANFSANKWKKYSGELNYENIKTWIDEVLTTKKWDGPGDGLFSSLWIQLYGVSTLPTSLKVILSFLIAVLFVIVAFIVFDSIRMCRDDNMKLE